MSQMRDPVCVVHCTLTFQVSLKFKEYSFHMAICHAELEPTRPKRGLDVWLTTIKHKPTNLWNEALEKRSERAETKLSCLS